LNSKLALAENIQKRENKTASASITAEAKKMNNGVYEINIQVSITQIDPFTGESTTDKTSGTIAFASHAEVLETSFGISQSYVNQIANQVLETAKFNARVDEK
jgi:hypothetical protein